jgi:hypothetical protein
VRGRRESGLRRPKNLFEKRFFGISKNFQKGVFESFCSKKALRSLGGLFSYPPFLEVLEGGMGEASFKKLPP